MTSPKMNKETSFESTATLFSLTSSPSMNNRTRKIFAESSHDAPISPCDLQWKRVESSQVTKLLLCEKVGYSILDLDLGFIIDLPTLTSPTITYTCYYIHKSWFVQYQQQYTYPSQSSSPLPLILWCDASLFPPIVDYRIGIAIHDKTGAVVTSRYKFSTIKSHNHHNHHNTHTTPPALLLQVRYGTKQSPHSLDVLTPLLAVTCQTSLISGRVLQRNIYGEVYQGHLYRSDDDNIGMAVAVKMIDCYTAGSAGSSSAAAGRSASAVICSSPQLAASKLYRPYQNENFLQEIEAMHFLQHAEQAEQEAEDNEGEDEEDGEDGDYFLPYECIYQDGYHLLLVTKYLPHGSLFDYLIQHQTAVQPCSSEQHQPQQLLADGDNGLYKTAGLPEEQVKVIMLQLAQALASLHRLGMSHQDVSLENILLVEAAGAASGTEVGQAKVSSSSCIAEDDSNSNSSWLSGYTTSDEAADVADTDADQQLMKIVLMDFGQVIGQQQVETKEEEGSHHHFWKAVPRPLFPVGKYTNQSPELLDLITKSCCYQPMAVDSWQLGIIFFILLTGQPPFAYQPGAANTLENNRVRQAWMKRIKQGEEGLKDMPIYCTSSKKKEPLGKCNSLAALDLLQGLLKWQPDERLSMEEVLVHPFLYL